MTDAKIREKISKNQYGKGALIGFESCIMPVVFYKGTDGYYIYKANTNCMIEDVICHSQNVEGLVQFMQGALWYRLNGGQLIAKKISRNDYYRVISEIGRIPTKGEYEILPLDLAAYSLNEGTIRIANAYFTEETTDKKGNYMLRGHWLNDRCYEFAKKCKFDLTQVDGYSAYAFSDDQMAIFTYTEGDIYLTLFTDKEKYELEKTETIRFYKEEY